MAVVEIHNLTKRFYSRAYPEGLVALDNVSFAVREREFLCLLGPSGCGKSTILNILAGLERQYEGKVLVNGRNLEEKGNQTLTVGYVFQDPRLLPWLTIHGNIVFALESVGVPQDEWNDRTALWLRRVGLEKFAQSHPHELSGGMRQRASIARAFAVDPDILLMDEPFSGLDELTARTMRAQLLELWAQSRKTVIFVTHNCFEASYLADRLLIMSPRPGRLKAVMPVPLPRPRDYESPQLFELSVAVTRRLLDEGPGPLAPLQPGLSGEPGS